MVAILKENLEKTNSENRNKSIKQYKALQSNFTIDPRNIIKKNHTIPFYNTRNDAY